MRPASPSMRGRGSKRRRLALRPAGRLVALHARAWIETYMDDRYPAPWKGRPPCEGVDRNLHGTVRLLLMVLVALHARAWIETRHRTADRCSGRVALHARAWIETVDYRDEVADLGRRPPCEGVDRNLTAISAATAAAWSPSMRGRGSKLSIARALRTDWGRPPCEGVDRNKLLADKHPAVAAVALHARAWIETPRPISPRFRRNCRPPCEGVDRNGLSMSGVAVSQASPSMRGRGSKQQPQCQLTSSPSRPPCEGVDRNDASEDGTGRGTPSPSMRGRGSKPSGGGVHVFLVCRPPCEGVDRNYLRPFTCAASIRSPSMRGRGSKPER